MTKFRFLLLSLLITITATSQEFDLGKILKKEKYAQLQLEQFISGHLHLTMKINGVEGRFILDTGAGGTVIEKGIADKFKLAAQDTDGEASGAGGAGMSLQQATENKIEIKGVKKKDVTLYLMDLNHVNEALEKMGIDPVDGVIGADLLRLFGMIIDYPNLMLYYK